MGSLGVSWRSFVIGGFPKIRFTFLGIPIISIIIWGVYIGVPLFRETTICCLLCITDKQLKPFSEMVARPIHQFCSGTSVFFAPRVFLFWVFFCFLFCVFSVLLYKTCIKLRLCFKLLFPPRSQGQASD